MFLYQPFTVVLALCLAQFAYAVNPPFEQPRSLNFIQNRGGIIVDSTYRKNNRWWLTVSCNVSGIKKFTHTPNHIHAGLAWSKSVAVIEDGAILLTVYTAQQGTRAPSAVCGDAVLSRFDPGYYKVYYLDPDGTRHELGEVEL